MQRTRLGGSGGRGGGRGLGPQSREKGAAPPECEEEAQRGLLRGHAGEGNNHKGRSAKGGGSLEATGVGRMLIQPNRPSQVIKHTKKLPSSKTICLLALSTGSSLVAQSVKSLPAMRETPVQFLGQEDPLEKG